MCLTDEPPSDAELLGSVELFRSLPSRELRALAVSAIRRDYGRAELILGPGSGQDEQLYVVVEGSARLLRLSPRGDEITLGFIAPGDVFGVIFGNAPTEPKSVVQSGPHGATVFALPRADFRRLMAQYPAVAVTALSLVSRRLAHAYDLVEDLALHDTATRLLRALERLAAQTPDGVVRVTHDELARMVGASREKVTKLLGRLRREGMVDFQPHRRGIRLRTRPPHQQSRGM